MNKFNVCRGLGRYKNKKGSAAAFAPFGASDPSPWGRDCIDSKRGPLPKGARGSKTKRLRFLRLDDLEDLDDLDDLEETMNEGGRRP